MLRQIQPEVFMILVPFACLTLVLLGGLAALAAAGFRNGDRPGDATVTAVLAVARQPDGSRPVIVATVVNRSAVPVMVGLRARRFPVAGTLAVRVPWRTAGRRYLAGEQDTVGVVPPREQAVFQVPVRAAGRRYRLTAVIGQSGGRLRVLTVPVTGTVTLSGAATRPTRASM
jgi:hypothetical protein